MNEFRIRKVELTNATTVTRGGEVIPSPVQRTKPDSFLVQADTPSPPSLPLCYTPEPMEWRGTAPYSTDLKCSKKIHRWGGKLALGRLLVEVRPWVLEEHTEMTIERIPAGDPNTFSYQDAYIIRPEGLKLEGDGMNIKIRIPTEEAKKAGELVFVIEPREGAFVTYGNNSAQIGEVTYMNAWRVRYTGKISLKPWVPSAMLFMDQDCPGVVIIPPVSTPPN